MKTIYFVSLLSVGMIITSCDSSNYDSKPDYNSQSNDYLPLQVGNYWNFIPVGVQNSGYTVHREITEKTVRQGHEYYLLVSTSSSDNYSYKDSLYLRIADNVYVYSLRADNTREDNFFRLNGNDGDSWSYAIDDHDKATIMLASVDVEINSTTIKDCKAFYFNVENWADEEYTRTLAKGIGFVKEYSNAWGMGEILKSARINGIEIDF